MESLIKVRREALPYRSTGKAVVVQIDKFGGMSSVKSISERLHKKYFTVMSSVKNLEKCGRVEYVRPGVYRLTERGKQDAFNLKGSVPEVDSPVKVTVTPPEVQEPVEFKFELRGEEGKKVLAEMLEDARKQGESEYWKDNFVKLAFEIAKSK